jgi:hypothetical protein
VKVGFLEIAEIELDEAVRWYDAQAPGLGDAFLIEVLSAAGRIVRFPDILVLAVAHLHRHPDYWRDRLKP